MSWTMDHILIRKNSKATGEASVKFIDEDGNALNINKLQIDLNNGSSPVETFKVQGTPLVTGNTIDAVKEIVLSICQDALANEPVGLFKCVSGKIERL